MRLQKKEQILSDSPGKMMMSMESHGIWRAQKSMNPVLKDKWSQKFETELEFLGDRYFLAQHIKENV